MERECFPLYPWSVASSCQEVVIKGMIIHHKTSWNCHKTSWLFQSGLYQKIVSFPLAEFAIIIGHEHQLFSRTDQLKSCTTITQKILTYL